MKKNNKRKWEKGMKKVVLVTGSSKGIGKATAIEFAKKNYDVVINYVTDKENVEKLA